MPSFIWNRDPQEAMDNPYEYDAQEQFIREASLVIKQLALCLDKHNMTFKVQDKTLKKALWMLYNDSLDSLKDALESLKNKKHRIAGKLFRDVIESMDLAAYFSFESAESKQNLEKWFEDEIISHRVYRDFLGKNSGQLAKEESRDYYRLISKFTHRTYKILLYSYVLGRDNYIAYDGHIESDILILPQTIAMYLAILADFIRVFSMEIIKTDFIAKEEMNKIWESSFEMRPVPRRFAISYRNRED